MPQASALAGRCPSGTPALKQPMTSCKPSQERRWLHQSPMPCIPPSSRQDGCSQPAASTSACLKDGTTRFPPFVEFDGLVASVEPCSLCQRAFRSHCQLCLTQVVLLAQNLEVRHCVSGILRACIWDAQQTWSHVKKCCNRASHLISQAVLSCQPLPLCVSWSVSCDQVTLVQRHTAQRTTCDQCTVHVLRSGKPRCRVS